ncbi:MAG TPA: tubulin-like doman-containing protein [Gemmataceae bacterium]
MSWLREPDAEPIPGYRLIEPLGAGGFGEVWKCVAPGGLLKAIKFVYGSLDSEDVDAVRADQEKRALERIKGVRHPFVLSNERIDKSDDGELMIVMELADKSLYDLFAECQATGLPGIPRADLLRYLTDAADGLDFMIESHNLQHLDVKPRNLFLISGRVKVADFGLVKSLDRSSSSGLMGGVTPIYAAPETFKNRISKHSDQYSLAVVYMELLTGKRPFNGKNVRQIALQHLADPPELSPLPEADRPVVGRALAKKPEDRFPSCLAFISALRPPMSASVAAIDLGELADVGRVAAAPAPPAPPDSPSTDIVRAASSPEPEPIVVEEGPPPTARIPDLRDLGRQSPVRRNRVAPPRTATGILRPTLVIGVGAFGRHALLGLRSRLLDRYGGLEQMPSFRFLYLDSDPDAVQKATAGTSEVALTSAEVFPLPLQPVAKYRQRVLEHLSEWLPREKLYNIPRSLQAGSVRALGRLAFCDNFLRVQARLRRELTTATQTEALLATAEHTRLPAADNCPRVYVLASGTDGVSGLLTDLGYAVRRQLDQLDFPHAPTTAVVYCGAPLDPATPVIEQSNLYGTLTELNHYHDDGVPFQAQYDPNGPQFADHGPPFGGVYLTLRRDRTPEAQRECVARVATYLTHDLVTPLGADLDRRREAEPPPQAVPFRAFGTATVWYPRGLLLHVAARMTCARVLEYWRGPDPPTAPAEVEAAATSATAASGLSPDALVAALDRAAARPGEGTPADAVERLLASLEVQAAGAADPGHWAAQALERVREWAGSGVAHDPDSPWQKSRFFRPLHLAAKQLAGQWAERMTDEVLVVLQYPGHRLANGEAAIRKLIEFCDQGIAIWSQQAERHYDSLRPVRDGLPDALAQCSAGGFKLFGGGVQRALRAFLAHLGQFARLRIAQDRLECGLYFFRSLRGELDDRLRDLGFSRQRLKALEQVLTSPVGDWNDPASGPDNGSVSGGLALHDPFWEAVQGTGSVEVMLPFGIPDLEETAEQLVASLQPGHLQQLDEELQEKVLAPLGDLMTACTGNTNLLRHLGRPLIEQTALFLGALLPITDVAQVEFSAAENTGADLGERFQRVYAQAAPEAGPADDARSAAFLLVPDSDAGRTLALTAQRALPQLQRVYTPSPAEMTICREADNLTLAELQQILNYGRMAYQELAPQPPTSPHARFDVPEWLPLEP